MSDSQKNIDLNLNNVFKKADIYLMVEFYNTFLPQLTQNLDKKRELFQNAVDFKSKVDKSIAEGADMSTARITKAVLTPGEEQISQVPLQEAYERVSEFLDRFEEDRVALQKYTKLYNKLLIVIEEFPKKSQEN